MSDDTQYGKLREKAHRKKKVDVWTFYSPFADTAARIAGYIAVIELRNGCPEGLHFVAMSDHFNSPIKDTDIKRLREKVERAFRLADMAARNIKWEDWIEITMDEETFYKDQHGAGLLIEWAIIKRGVHPESGVAYTINHNNVVTEFPKPKAAGENDQSRDDDKWHTGSRDLDSQFSYLPATAANVIALEVLSKRIVDARARLRELLNQANVQKSLATGGRIALEGPK